MENTGQIVAIIGLLASLFLAVHAFKADGFHFRDKAWMIVAWAVIITVLSAVLSRYA